MRNDLSISEAWTNEDIQDGDEALHLRENAVAGNCATRLHSQPYRATGHQELGVVVKRSNMSVMKLTR